MRDLPTTGGLSAVLIELEQESYCTSCLRNRLLRFSYYGLLASGTILGGRPEAQFIVGQGGFKLLAWLTRLAIKLT